MKKIVLNTFIALILGLILCIGSVWGVDSWYVDPVSGNDNFPLSPDEHKNEPDYPYRHIWKALDVAASGDNIYLKSGDYNNEGIRMASIQGSDWNRLTHIYVDKSVTIDDYGSPRIVGYCSSASLDSLYSLFMMIVDASNVTIKDIEFDGFNFYYSGFYPDFDWWLIHHGTLEISGNGSYTTIQNCEFQHMGRSYNYNSEDDGLKHESIIGSHPMGVDDGYAVIYGVQILENTFTDNLFDTFHGHEIYLTKNSNATIEDNIIYNHGVGVPIRFSNACSNILVEGNMVYGAAETGYIQDWNSDDMDVSSGVRVIDNTFSTSGLYGSSMNANYLWPFISSGDSCKYSGFISEFTGNTVNSNYSDDNYVQAVTIGDDSLYIAQNDDEAGFLSSRIHRFPNPSGPIFRHCVGESYDGTLCRGDMCVMDDYIVTASVNSGGTYKLGYYLPDSDQGNATCATPALNSSDKVTALCASGFTERFITGITVSGTAKLYLGEVDDWDANLLWQSVSVDSITAIARNGSTLVFAGYDDSAETTTFYYGTLGTDPYSLSIQGSSSSGYTYAPAMAYMGNTLITATSTTYLTPEESRLYEGTASNPLNSCVYGPSTTTQFLSLAANSSYLFTVVSNTDNNNNHKLFVSDTTSDPFDELLFYSYWGIYDINEE